MSDAYDDLPPTRQVILELLAARYRLGEPVWPFSTSLTAHLNALQDLGFLSHEADATPKNRRVRLTNAGMDLMLDPDYTPPCCRKAGCGPALPVPTPPSPPPAVPPGAAGCWLAYYFDWSGFTVHDTEISALRAAVEKGQSVKFLGWGEPLSEGTDR